MSPKREKRRRAEEARRAKLRKRRRGIIIVLSLLAAAGLSVALPTVIARQARLARINVLISGGQGEPFGILAEALASSGGVTEQGLSGTIELYESPEALPPEERDVLVSPAAYGSPRERLVTADPYVLTLDRRAGESPLQTAGSTLSELTDWLSSLDPEVWTPLLIAGERKEDFAAFTLYLAGELLPPESREVVWNELRQTSRAARGERAPTEAMAGGAEALEALLQRLSPVIELVQGWKEREILVFNWTNYDRIAVEQAIREGRAAVVFQRRSELESLVWEEAFHLRMRLPPVGPNRRLYSMVGFGVSVSSGGGVRSDAAAPILSFLRSPDLQDAIERESSWSPMVQEGTPINREHRDVVRWIGGAQEVVLLEPALVDHPLFSRLHQILR